MAERLIRELSDRVEPLSSADEPLASSAKSDVMSSLEQLGYQYHAVNACVDEVMKNNPDTEVEQLIVKVLQQLGAR